MIILQSLLKFKKDLKSGTPVIVGNDHVVCVIVAIETDSCTNAGPVRVHFNRSDFSVWKKKIANRDSEPDSCCGFVCLLVLLLVFTEGIFSGLSQSGES